MMMNFVGRRDYHGTLLDNCINMQMRTLIRTFCSITPEFLNNAEGSFETIRKDHVYGAECLMKIGGEENYINAKDQNQIISNY